MRMPTFTKPELLTLCKYCGKGRVPVTKATRRCSECKGQGEETPGNGVTLGHRVPAATVKPTITKSTGEVTTAPNRAFVDKFGKEIENPGYDLDHDPNGWGFTGTKPIKERITIV